MKIKNILLVLGIALLVLAPIVTAKNFNITDGSSSLFFVNGSSGYIGVGTDSPQNNLDIYNTAASYLRIARSDSNYWGIGLPE